jgi:16S rRNA (guanine527-N7)-methyltransferase
MRNYTKSNEIENRVDPMLYSELPSHAYSQLARYVDLLERWGARMNLTAIRDREMLIRLHLGECLRCAQVLPRTARTVLDVGSGAGLPGIPIQIVWPELSVTLAESRVRKAAFLREAIRSLDLKNANVFANRAEALPQNRLFDVVTVRAAERMDQAVNIAVSRLVPAGLCVVLTTERAANSVRAAVQGVEWETSPIPGTRERILLIGRRAASGLETAPEL